MAAREPLVVINGQTQRLPAGDRVIGAMHWRGEWSSSAQYLKGDVTRQTDSLWAAVADNLDSSPELSSADWELMLGSGDTFLASWAGFDTATPDNPLSTLADFTFYLDLSQLSATWWSNVHATGKDIRATDSLDSLLATDLIDFDKGAQTGLLAFKFTKASSNQAVRVWAGNPNAALLAPDHTFGQYNAYDADHWGFWPDGGVTPDRTVNQRVLTPGSSSFEPTTAAGPIGNLATFYPNGGTNYLAIASGLNLAFPFTMTNWCRVDAGHLANPTCMGVANSTSSEANDVNSGSLNGFDSDLDARALSQGADGTFGIAASLGRLAAETWGHVATVFTSSSARSVFLNGADKASNSTALTFDPLDRFVLGGDTRVSLSVTIQGRLSLAALHTATRADDWVAYHAAMGDQVVFWNGWTWTAA